MADDDMRSRAACRYRMLASRHDVESCTITH
jgi:hypothetical protein